MVENISHFPSHKTIVEHAMAPIFRIHLGKRGCRIHKYHLSEYDVDVIIHSLARLAGYLYD
jgi:hypothetical protein